MYFGFPCQLSFHLLLHIHHHLLPGAGTISKLVADVRSGLNVTPPQETKKQKKKKNIYIYIYIYETDWKESYVHTNFNAASVQWRRDVSTGTLTSMKTELRPTVAFTVSKGLRLDHFTLNGRNTPFENEVNYFDPIFG
jgi:hypothetical protein